MTEHDPNYEDDEELELEAIDPEILENERRRVIRQTRSAEDSIDINEAYRDAAPSDPFELDSLKNIRFSIRHLMILTALLSIALTIIQYTDPCNGLLIVFVLTVISGWFLVIRKEKQQQLEAQRKKQIEQSRIAAQRAAEDAELEVTDMDTSQVTFDPPPKAPTFHFAFSMKELLGAFTIAAIILGLVQTLGGAQNAAVLLGSIALLGLVMHAVGFDPAPVVVLGWWILLVLYIVVSVIAALSPTPAMIVPFCMA